MTKLPLVPLPPVTMFTHTEIFMSLCICILIFQNGHNGLVRKFKIRFGFCEELVKVFLFQL